MSDGIYLDEGMGFKDAFLSLGCQPVDALRWPVRFRFSRSDHPFGPCFAFTSGLISCHTERLPCHSLREPDELIPDL